MGNLLIWIYGAWTCTSAMSISCCTGLADLLSTCHNSVQRNRSYVSAFYCRLRCLSIHRFSSLSMWFYDINNHCGFCSFLEQARKWQSCIIAEKFCSTKEDIVRKPAWLIISSLEKSSNNGNAPGATNTKYSSSLCITRFKFKVSFVFCFPFRQPRWFIIIIKTLTRF